MSEIVIRHAETRDYEAIRQIHAQPEVYYNTLQVPHPSEQMWLERLTARPGIKQLVACIDGIVVGHLTIDVQQRPRRKSCCRFWYLCRLPLEEPRRRQRPDARDD